MFGVNRNDAVSTYPRQVVLLPTAWNNQYTQPWASSFLLCGWAYEIMPPGMGTQHALFNGTAMRLESKTSTEIGPVTSLTCSCSYLYNKSVPECAQLQRRKARHNRSMRSQDHIGRFSSDSVLRARRAHNY